MNRSITAVSGFLAVICGIGIFALSGVAALAQEHSPSHDTAGNARPIRLAQEESSEAADEDPKEQEAKEKEEEKPRPRSAAPKRFIPTEKISADSAVSFPVDI